MIRGHTGCGNLVCLIFLHGFVKFTNDGRKLALEQRLINEMLPDEPDGKINARVEEVYKFWQEGKGIGLGFLHSLRISITEVVK